MFYTTLLNTEQHTPRLECKQEGAHEARENERTSCPAWHWTSGQIFNSYEYKTSYWTRALHGPKIQALARPVSDPSPFSQNSLYYTLSAIIIYTEM